MIGYASRTGTRRNLAALRGAGWRLLVTPACLRTEGFPYALDNGAWSAHQQRVPFDAAAFVSAVVTLGRDADWIVLPDIVGGGVASLDLSLSWIHPLKLLVPHVRLLLPVQDGMTVPMVERHLGAVGIFVGGTTEWKIETMPVWGRLKQEVGCYLHVGRVNSRRRIRTAALAGADSFDGTSASRYAVTLPKLDAELRQQVLGGPHVGW